MALALFDRVQETTTTTGTGSVTLGGAVPGFQSFAVVGNGNTCYYTIVDGSAWEVGVGTYSTSGPTLARTTILSNSNGNTAAITLAAGTKSVFLTYPASKSVNLNESGNVSPLGTVSSGVWQGTTVGVAYGGTGVTASSGANSVVLRDASQNITVNRINQGLLTTTASGGTTTLTAASAFNQALVGTGGHTYRLPDATTLSDTTAFQFNNNSTGTLTIQNNAGTSVGTIAPGGAAGIALLSNATVGGTWDVHAYIPENVTWGTNALALGSTVISGGTWQGGTIATGYGGTGLTSYTSGGAVYANSSTTLTSGTLPVTAGGTGATTAAGAQSSLNVPSTTGLGASGTWGINITGSAGSLPNAVTFNSGGSGDASGTSFNGAAARTISYNTIGAPSTSGTNASGTWSINVTGSAGSASSATTSTYVTSQDIRTLSPSSTAAARMAFGFTSWANNNSGPYADYLAMRSYIDASGGNDNLLMLNKSTIAMRVYQQAYGSATAYSSYADVLMSNNYNSYAPTLSGGGATGTWAINISGNAATATLATSAITLTSTQSNWGSTGVLANVVGLLSWRNYGNSHVIFDASAGLSPSGSSVNTSNSQYAWTPTYPTLMGWNGGQTYGLRVDSARVADSAGAVDYNALTNKGGGTGSYITSGDYRAPIFYDSGNTAYYGDFASTSQFNEATFAGYIGLGGSTPTARMSGTSGISIYNASYPSVGFSTPSGPDYLIYRLGNAGALAVWNSSGYETVYFYTAYTQFTGSARAPIFYDSDNTAYYVDPNNSTISAVFAGPVVAAGGLQSATSGYTSPYNIFTLSNTYNGGTYYGIKYVEGNPDTIQFIGNSTVGLTVGMDVGDTTASSSLRAPIFYDSNNTGYYLDPASTSNLVGLTVANTISGSISSVSATTATGIQTNYVAAINTTTPGQTTYGIAFSGSSSTDNAQGITWGWSGTAAQAGIYVQSSGSYGTKMYFGTTDSFATGSKTSMSIDHLGVIQVPRSYLQSDSSLRAPIFYDSNNTGYYLDPASTSNLNQVNLQGYLRRNVSNSGYLEGYYGTATSGATSNCIYTIGGAYQPGTTNLGNMYGCGYQVGNEGASPGLGGTGWGLYVASGGTSRIFLDSDNGNGYASSSFRASIFYDRDNTSYYLDPTSLTSLRTVGDWRSDSSTWSGEFPGKMQYHSNNWYLQYAGSMLFRNPSGANVMDCNTSGDLTVSSSSRAPIFYDSNNTGFYVDPASSSILNSLNLTSGVLSLSGVNVISRGGTWTEFRDPSGATKFWLGNDASIYMNASNYYLRSNDSGSTWVDINASLLQHSSSLRAPIFYDSNNTGYYLDPNGTSEINKTYYNANQVSRNYGIGQIGLYASTRFQAVFSMGEAYILPADGTTAGNLYGIAWSYPSAGGVAANLNTHGALFLENGAFMAAVSGSIRCRDDMRAPIFYDQNNTAYYVNPNSDSRLSSVYANDYFRAQGSTGLYLQDYAYYFDRNPDVYGNWRCGVNPQNSYVGISYAYSSSRVTTMFDSTGNGGLYNYSYWIYYWLVGNACLGVRTSTTSSSYAMYVEGGIYSTGNVVAYSDVRKKRNIVTVDNALDTVNKLRGVFYNRIETNDEKVDPNKRQIGVIAQEVNEVLPEAVTYAKDVDEYGVQYGNMAGLFIEAIKELTAKIDALEQRIAA